MAAPEILIMKFYRRAFGDVDARDMRAIGETVDETKSALRKALLSHFQSGRFASGQQPHSAALVGEDGRIVAVIRVVSNKNGRYECEEVAIADWP